MAKLYRSNVIPRHHTVMRSTGQSDPDRLLRKAYWKRAPSTDWLENGVNLLSFSNLLTQGTWTWQMCTFHWLVSSLFRQQLTKEIQLTQFNE